MKTTFLLVSILCMTVAGCIGDPTIDTDEAEVLVSAPDAGEPPVEGIITEWCELHPWDARCSTGEGGGGGTGGVGGSGGGGGSSGDPLPCLGTSSTWCARHSRCEMTTACSPLDAVPPVPFEDAICRRSTDSSPCYCIY
jgi:hypothetical protein